MAVRPSGSSDYCMGLFEDLCTRSIYLGRSWVISCHRICRYVITYPCFEYQLVALKFSFIANAFWEFEKDWWICDRFCFLKKMWKIPYLLLNFFIQLKNYIHTCVIRYLCAEKSHTFIVLPHNIIVGAYIGFTLLVGPSVHPSIHLSICR